MRISRRGALSILAAAGATWMAIGDRFAPALERPPIRPRTDWAQGRDPRGALEVEKEDDVRFLLVHHSASPNTDSPDAMAARIRGFYDYHTGTKGWPDVAYNFFVDRHGLVWEGRAGSLERPVRGDATGGSQGYALLCCFIGDHSTEPPSPAAMNAMAGLLAWLASKYRIDLSRGADITFTSRGSSRHPAGTTVSTGPIAAHRDMSQTECPGEALYPLVQSELLPMARARVLTNWGLAVLRGG